MKGCRLSIWVTLGDISNCTFDLYVFISSRYPKGLMYGERINTKTKPMKTEMRIKDKKRYSRRWHNLQWNKITKYVEVLQKEIALAKRSRKTSKMYALQDKLLRSFQGRALAVRRATALNKGKTTAGIDGVLYTKAYEKYAAISELKTLLEMKSYKADPVIRVYIPKPNTDKWRPLGTNNERSVLSGIAPYNIGPSCRGKIGSNFLRIS